MYASPFHSSATQYPAEFIPSPPPSSFSRPITSCLPCRSRKVKCDRRQPLCLVCERGDYTCSYVSKPQSKPQAAGLVSGMSRITKPKSAPKISSSTLARINPGLRRLGNFMAQAKAYEASEHSLSTLDSSTPTRSTPASHNPSPQEPRSQEDALILDNGVPHFVSGRHWAWMAAEVRSPFSLKLALIPRQRCTNQVSAPLAQRHPIGSRGIPEFLTRTGARRCYLECRFTRS